MSQLQKGGLYKHYKGNLYKVIDVVRHSEDLKEHVLYECLYENELGKLWVRPLDMFLETIIIDGQERARFEYVGDQKGSNRMP